MSTSYRRLRRRLDEAERLMARMRRDMLALAIEVHQLDRCWPRLSPAPEIARLARRVTGMREPGPQQLPLVAGGGR